MPTDCSTRKLNILICDDNPHVLSRLHTLSQQALLSNWNVAYQCVTDADACTKGDSDIHVAVLDIKLGNDSGIALARRLLERNPNCQIVFVSGYPQYVSDVYDVPHLGMILKDQLEQQLPKFLLRAAESIQTCREQQLLVPANRALLRLNISTVLYLERKEHVTFVHLNSGREIRTRKKLGELLAQPAGSSLCRCHVSYVVNFQHVSNLQGRTFFLTNADEIPISRIYLQNARAAYFNYLQRLI